MIASGGCHYRPDPARFISLLTLPLTESVVQVWCAKVPQIPDAAYHCWFLSYTPGDRRWRRQEVWHEPGVDCDSCGHIRRDRLPLTEGMDGRPGWQILQWRGDAASAVQAVLDQPHDYPYQNRYRYWPGPNSNTYISWVVRRAKVRGELPPQAIGKDYLGLIGGAGITISRTGVQLESPILGVAVGLTEGLELHILCLTFGLDPWPPALKTPVGRMGFGP